MKGLISTKTFGYINYPLALLMMVSPWLFCSTDGTPFWHVSAAALFFPLVFGWFHLLMAIFSKSKAGMVGIFPIQMHCTLDVISGFAIAMSPFLYGFYHKVFLPHLILGGIIFFLGIYTKNSPLLNQPHEMIEGEYGIQSTDAHEQVLTH